VTKSSKKLIALKGMLDCLFKQWENGSKYPILVCLIDLQMGLRGACFPLTTIIGALGSRNKKF